MLSKVDCLKKLQKLLVVEFRMSKVGRHDHRRNMRKWLSLEEALKRFPNISTTWKIQRIKQVCCAIPVISPRRKHQIQSHACLIQNKLVERPNTSYMMKSLDPLEFGRLRHKSSLLPGPDLLVALFINMIFERTFWVRILVWILFFCYFLWQISRKSMLMYGTTFSLKIFYFVIIFWTNSKRNRQICPNLQVDRPKFSFFPTL
jgi:hypothetical protein